MTNIFKYTTKARPTTYNGINFRSELEAAWAAFFDLRSIAYEYEPLLNLKAWRPDFSITVNDPFDDFALAEVKSYVSLTQWKEDSDTLLKIRDSFSSSCVVSLLGVNPLLPANFLFTIAEDMAGNPADYKFERLDFGDDSDSIKKDWLRARNTVMWRPN